VADELNDIVELVRAGSEPMESVRELLRRFRFAKRGYHKVRHVRRSLEAAGLITDPDFNSVSLDSPVKFKSAADDHGKAGDAATVATPTQGSDEDTVSPAAEDPAYRMRRLDDSSQVLVYVAPDEDLRRAITLMMTNDFSQLPVMTGIRTVKGMITWRTIGLTYGLGGAPSLVRDSMETDVVVLDADLSLFAAIPRIVANDYGLVRRTDGTYWIVTTSDLSVRFKDLAEPFLLLSEIENQLRGLLDEHIAQPVLEGARDPEDADRTIDSAADLTLGEVVRLLEQQAVWVKLAPRLDRVEVVKQLDRVRSIRNDVMHFDPEGLDPSDLEALRSFARFLQEFRQWDPTSGLEGATGASSGALT
jgi:CBS domain-containing protein